MSNLDDVLCSYEFGDLLKLDIISIFLELVPEPVGSDGVDNYDEPTKSVLIEIRERINQL